MEFKSIAIDSESDYVLFPLPLPPPAVTSSPFPHFVPSTLLEIQLQR